MAKENNIELEAKAIDAEEAVSEAKELSDDELSDIAAGAAYLKNGYMIVTCDHYCKSYRCNFYGEEPPNNSNPKTRALWRRNSFKSCRGERSCATCQFLNFGGLFGVTGYCSLKKK